MSQSDQNFESSSTTNSVIISLDDVKAKFTLIDTFITKIPLPLSIELPELKNNNFFDSYYKLKIKLEYYQLKIFLDELPIEIHNETLYKRYNRMTMNLIGINLTSLQRAMNIIICVFKKVVK